MMASNILSTYKDTRKIFDKFLICKSNKIGILTKDIKIRKAIARICLMMRLSDQDEICIVEKEILNNLKEYETLIYELNLSGYYNKAILLYYAPAFLNNTVKFYKENLCKNPIKKALRLCLPFMQRVMKYVRKNMECKGYGVITVMLRDVAIAVCEDTFKLSLFEVNILSKEEAEVKLISIKEYVENMI